MCDYSLYVYELKICVYTHVCVCFPFSSLHFHWLLKERNWSLHPVITEPDSKCYFVCARGKLTSDQFIEDENCS